MKKHATLVGTILLSALVGGTVVWSFMREGQSGANTYGNPGDRTGAKAGVGTRKDSHPRADFAAGIQSEPDALQSKESLANREGAEGNLRQDVAYGQTSNVNAETFQGLGVANSSKQRQSARTMRRNDNPAPVDIVDEVVVPIPREVFAALDRLGNPDWKQVLRPMKEAATPRSELERTALLLGVVIAEGFVAIEAQDNETVKKIGRSVLPLAEALGVRKAVIRRSNAIVEAAERRDWSRTRREFDGALADVREGMRELNSGFAADLVSLGGWIRGTDALVSVLRVDYRPDTADLLNQPGLVDHFTGRIATGGPAERRDPSVKQKKLSTMTILQTELSFIRPLMETPSGSMSKEAVEKIGEATGRLVRFIEAK